MIVSRDNDLLDLMTGTDSEAEAFRGHYPEMTILDPLSFMQTIRSALPDPPDQADERTDEAS